MKKLLIILLSISLLAGCSPSKTWEDVVNIYSQVENEVKSVVENVKIITKEDYETILKEITTSIDSLQFSLKDENEDLLKKLYKGAIYIEMFSSIFKGNCAQQLLALSKDIITLVKLPYGGDSNTFDAIKNSIKTKIDEIKNWTKEDWRSVEQLQPVIWDDDIAQAFQTLEENAKDDLTAYNELTEHELDELKHSIIDNYDLIKNGIDTENDKIARQMYTAASKLEAYTKRIYSEEADNVYYFAKHIKSFIKQCYGKVLEEDEIFDVNYDEEVAAARKWTQSTWNIITTELKALVR